MIVPFCQCSEETILERGSARSNAVKRHLSAASLSVLIAGSILADTHYVSGGGSDTPPFTSWTTAARQIQAAIDDADSGDTVCVTDGFYVVFSEIKITNAVLLKSTNGAGTTTIYGAYPSSTNRCLSVVSRNAVVCGFTIANGHEERDGGGCRVAGTLRDCVISSNKLHHWIGHGGGVFLEATGRLEGCLISSNSSANAGGGVYCSSGGTLLTCTVEDNWSQNGGGVHLNEGGMMSNCVVRRNSSMWYGGGVRCERGGYIQECNVYSNQATRGAGVYFLGDAGTVKKCFIRYNRAIENPAVHDPGEGGGVYCDYGGRLENNVIADNTAQNGGGVYLREGGKVRHCTIVNNVAQIGGGILRNLAGTVEYSIVYFNSSNWFVTGANTFSQCCLTPQPPDSGNVASDPMLAASTDRYWHLEEGSPCIDTGTNLVAVGDDVSSVPRPLDGDNDGTAVSDIGAFEYVHSHADSDVDGIPDAWELGNGLNPTTNQASIDLDADTFTCYEEYISDTRPLDANSFFFVNYTQPQTVGYASSSNRAYSLYFRQSLTTGAWQAVAGQTNVGGTGSQMYLHNTNALSNEGFYRVKVSLP